MRIQQYGDRPTDVGSVSKKMIFIPFLAVELFGPYQLHRNAALECLIPVIFQRFWCD